LPLAGVEKNITRLGQGQLAPAKGKGFSLARFAAM